MGKKRQKKKRLKRDVAIEIKSQIDRTDRKREREKKAKKQKMES